MRHFFSTRIRVVLILALLLTGVLAVVGGLTGMNIPSMIVQGVLTPLRSGANALTNQAEQMYNYMFRYEALQAENEALRKELEKFQKLENMFYEAINENEELRKLTEIREKHSDFQCELAAVVSTIEPGIHSSFTINKGALVGIEVGDCVITEAGLVGYIDEVGPNFSTVITVLNIKFSATVLNTRTRETLVAQGNFEFAPKGELKLSWLDHHSNILSNDVVVTSGSTKYPPNLTIGTIRTFAVEDHGISSYATIEPAVDFSRLTDVFVVKSFEVVN